MPDRVDTKLPNMVETWSQPESLRLQNKRLLFREAHPAGIIEAESARLLVQVGGATEVEIGKVSLRT